MNETKISSLILKSGQKLISILIPKIIDLVAVKSKIDTKLIIKVISMDKESAKQGGIDEILKQAGKIGVCIPAVPLQAIVDVRNSMMDTLNAASTTINTLSLTLDPLKTISDVTDVTIITAKTTISVSKLALSSIPPPFIVPPPFSPPFAPTVNAAMLQVEAIEKIIETLKFNLNGIINQIDSTQGAIDSVNPILTKITNLFKVIDKYLLGCNVNATANTLTLTTKSIFTSIR
jgi:DNA-binding FrmR family transcriptional regulator